MSGAKAPDPAGRPQDQRKLVAVVYADMVGYSRLIEIDDAGTIQRLRALRREVIDPAIGEHGGRIVQTGGDSLLIVFDSIDGAVRCAITVQQQVPVHDGEQPSDRAMRFRIGINLGDAIADGTDLHGDAVNVAARLQAECPPGGICVSRSVRDHVHGRLDLAFEELGLLNLKNIIRLVEAFVLRFDGAAASKERQQVYDTGEGLPLPGKPSIAVLAFTNMSGDLEQEYFSDGIADDIITELSRSRSLFVIARNSSFAYRGQSIDVRRIARELGVRYVLEGSVRRSGSRIRVTSQLIDAETGNHIWAERYDRSDTEVFVVQDEITMAVVTAIEPAVTDAEFRRILRKPPENLGAWEAYQRGLWHFGKANAAETARAKNFFSRAVALDSAFAPAYSAMAMAYVFEGRAYATLTLEEGDRLAVEWALKALEVDGNDEDAHALLGLVTATAHLEAGQEHVSLALTNSPNSPWANWIRASILTFGGHPAEGREALLNVLRLSPRDPHSAEYICQVSLSYYFERDYTNATLVARRAVSRYPDYPLTYRWLAASLGQLGQIAEAHAVLERAMAISQASLDFYTRSRPPWFRSEDYEHMLDGLRKAGWQG